jgi:hypothetical protein
MHPDRKTSVLRRKWIVATFIVLCVVAIAFAIVISSESQTPKVVPIFVGFTNGASGRCVAFSLSNASPLIVFVEMIYIGGKSTPCPALTIPAGQSSSVAALLPFVDIKAEPPEPVRLVPLPAEIEFHLRRQDTALEEGREMLDSVLRSVRISVPGLNPDSARNRFQIRSEVPKEEESSPPLP